MGRFEVQRDGSRFAFLRGMMWSSSRLLGIIPRSRIRVNRVATGLIRLRWQSIQSPLEDLRWHTLEDLRRQSIQSPRFTRSQPIDGFSHLLSSYWREPTSRVDALLCLWWGNAGPRAPASPALSLSFLLDFHALIQHAVAMGPSGTWARSYFWVAA